jgi:HlyD family secretion protein
LGAAGQDGLVEVVNGLNVTDKLISSGADSLQNGDPVVVSGEDQTIGVGR